MKFDFDHETFILFGFVLFLLYILIRSIRRQPFVSPRNEDEQKRLNELIRRGQLLVDYIHTNKYPDAQIAQRIYSNWNILRTNNRIGITPADTDTPGFVINKSDSMQICVTKNPGIIGDLDEINLNTFVLIHEIAHLGAKEYEHGNEFIQVFKKLLRASIDIGIWDYVDYSKKPQTFCNYYVNATPKVPETFTTVFKYF